MKFEIRTFCILFVGIIFFVPLVIFAQVSETEIENKINQYVIDQSGISEEYFYKHYNIKILNIRSYESICNSSEERMGPGGDAFPRYVFCGKECPGPDCKDETSFVVKAKWDFKINGYEGEVGDQVGARGIYVEEPREFGFIFKNNEVKEHARYVYLNQVIQNRPFPKFEEISATIPQSELEAIKNDCGIFTRPNAIKITTGLFDDKTHSLLFYSWGKNKGGKDVELLVNLENGENKCKEIILFRDEGGRPGGFKTSVFNHPSLIFLIVGLTILIFFVVLVIVYKKFKK